MKKRFFHKGIIWILITALCLPVLPSSRVWAKETYSDPMTGDIYEDFPPVELLQGRSSKDQSDLLQQWQGLGGEVKSAYREYIKCKKDLAEAEKNLARAKAEKSAKEAEYKTDLENLKKLLIKAMLRLGVATGVVVVDAAANAYLAGKEIKESIAEGKSKSKTPEEIQAQKADAQEAQRLTSEAAQKEQFTASLQKSLEEADAKISKIKAEKEARIKQLQSAQAETPKGEPVKPPTVEIPKGNFETRKMLSGKDTWDQEFGVKPFSPEVRQQYKVTIRDGKFYDAQGNLLDTGHSIGSHGYQGRGIFVMDKEGNIYLHTDPIQGKIHHSSIAGGEEVAAAGQMRIENGVLTNIDPTSGHYPYTDLFPQALRRLRDLGIDRSTYTVDPFK